MSNCASGAFSETRIMASTVSSAGNLPANKGEEVVLPAVNGTVRHISIDAFLL